MSSNKEVKGLEKNHKLPVLSNLQEDFSILCLTFEGFYTE